MTTDRPMGIEVTQALLPVTQADRDFAILACRLTGWEGVAQRLEQGWEPDADTNEGKLVEAAARHRDAEARRCAAIMQRITQSHSIPVSILEASWDIAFATFPESPDAFNAGVLAARIQTIFAALCDGMTRAEVHTHLDMVEAHDAIAAWNTRQSSIASLTYAEGRAEVDYWNSVAVGLGHESVCEALEALERLQSPPLTDAPDVVRKWRTIKQFCGMPRDGTWFAARCTAPGYSAIRIVHYADRQDRLPIDHSDWVWPSVPTEWMPLDEFAAALTTPPAKDDAGRLREALTEIEHVETVEIARHIARRTLSPQSEEDPKS